MYFSLGNPSCAGGVNLGSRDRICRPSNVYAWDGRTRQCRRIFYTGCGGNENRWCSQELCIRRCRGR